MTDKNEQIREATVAYKDFLAAVRAPIDTYFKPVWLERVDSFEWWGPDGEPVIQVGPENGAVAVPAKPDTDGFDAALADVCRRFGFQDPEPLSGAFNGKLRTVSYDARGARFELWLGDTVEAYVLVPLKP